MKEVFEQILKIVDVQIEKKNIFSFKKETNVIELDIGKILVSNEFT